MHVRCGYAVYARVSKSSRVCQMGPRGVALGLNSLYSQERSLIVVVIAAPRKHIMVEKGEYICYVDAGAVQFKCNLGHNLIQSKLQLAFLCK